MAAHLKFMNRAQQKRWQEEQARRTIPRGLRGMDEMSTTELAGILATLEARLQRPKACWAAYELKHAEDGSPWK